MRARLLAVMQRPRFALVATGEGVPMIGDAVRDRSCLGGHSDDRISTALAGVCSGPFLKAFSSCSTGP